jgi:hypothetical protein
MPDRNKISKWTSPKSTGTVSGDLWLCQFVWACLNLVTDLSAQFSIFILIDNKILALMKSHSKDNVNNLQLLPHKKISVSALSVVRFCVGKYARVCGTGCKLRFEIYCEHYVFGERKI